MASPEQGLNTLKTFLLQHGAIGPAVSALDAWAAFKYFGREVFDEKGVGLLFQVGVFSFSGEPLFYFDLVAQFEVVDDEGEHDHYEQTHCELTCPVSEVLHSIQRNLWSFDFATAEAFFQAVEALPEFHVSLSGFPYKVRAFHEVV